MLGPLEAVRVGIAVGGRLEGLVPRGDRETQSWSYAGFQQLLGSVMCVGYNVVRLGLVDSSLSGKPAFDKIVVYIQKAKVTDGDILIGGSGASPTISRFHISLPISIVYP